MQFQRVINTKETYREMFHILFTLSLQKPGYMLHTQYIRGLVLFFFDTSSDMPNTCHFSTQSYTKWLQQFSSVLI